MENVKLRIAGMSCAHCVAAVEKALARLPGVGASRVTVGEAEIEYDAARVGPAGIADAIRSVGFAPAEPEA